MRKKLLALLLAAALALSLLAGCGGESVASALLKLLDGRYPNISIEIDPELEADLRQAIRKAEAENAGDDAAVIRAALEKLVGFTVTFRKLGEGQKGDTTFDLVFYSGSDPDKAAQAAYSQWNIVFDNVPDDGQYDTSLAMVETNSGVWMLVKATVEKAGTVDKPDKDDDPEPQEPPEPTIVTGTGFTYNVTDGIITMKSEEDSSAENDLQNLFTPQTDEAKEITDARNSGFDKITIELEAGQTYTVSQQLAADFKGTLKGENESSKAKIELSSTSSLFRTIRDGGEVSNLDITVSNTINGGSYDVGAVAGVNRGEISGCDVTISNGGKIDGELYSAGGVVGWNYKTISDCTVTTEGNDAISGIGSVGGVAGTNNGEIRGCDVTISGTINGIGGTVGGVVGYNVSGSVTACYSTGAVSGTTAGGVVGQNSGTVTACYHANGTVSGNNYIGGVVGYNRSGGTVTACYHAGTVQGDSKNGGVVGRNWTGGTVNDCYWSGQVSGGYGIGYDDYYISPTNANANQVTDNGGTDPNKSPVNWNTAKTNLSKYGYTFGGDMDNPTLTKN